MGVGVSAAPRRVRIRVLGRVQGVGYRWFAARAARGLDLAGWVRNGRDGVVEVAVAGPAESVERLVVELRRGPTHALVRAVEVDEVTDDEPRLSTPFEIAP